MLSSNEEPLIRVSPKKRPIFFLILYSLFMVDFISRVGINVIFPVIQEDLALTDTQVGLMGSVVLLGMAIFVLPVSFLGEKHSPKKTITLSATIWTLGTFLSGLAGSFPALIASRFFVGMGNSAYAPLSNSMITSLYAKPFWGKKIGTYNTAMTLGGALGSIVFANIAGTLGWRIAFYTLAALSLLPTLASLALPDTKKLLVAQCNESDDVPTNHNPAAKVNLRDAFHVLGSNKALICVCMASSIVSMVLQGSMAWQSIFMVREVGLSIQTTALVLTGLALIAAIGYPLGGFIMDKWYSKDKRCRAYLPIICLSISSVLFVIIFKFKLIPLLMVTALFTAMSNTAYHVCTQELVPSWFKSTSYGMYALFVQGLGSCGPLLIGVLSQNFGLISALIIMQMFMIISILLFAYVSKLYIPAFNKARKLEEENGVCN